MIKSPKNWSYVYSKPTLDELESIMFNAVRDTKCPNLCLSGGVDSSLTLHFMAQVFPSIKCFTIAGSPNHPDVYYSKMIAEKYGVQHFIYIPTINVVKEAQVDGDLEGDVAVRLLYQFIAQYVDRTIATDCIDELDCGYYKHQSSPTDEVFRKFIAELEESHLKPLDKNSGLVGVYLPYATPEVIHAFLRLSIVDKLKFGRKGQITQIALKYLPEDIILRRKYGFCSALEGMTI
jgi:asparagine synthetase B (glutamine-hydrolysing)